MAVSQLDIRKLKLAIDAIFTHILENLHVETVALTEERDFYWAVPYDEAFSVKQPQPKLDIGRLTDDWAFLEAILEDKDQAVSLMLVHVAPLLEHIGLEIGQ